MPRVPELGLPNLVPERLPDAQFTPNAPLTAFGGGAADRTVDLRGVQRTMVNLYQEKAAQANQVAVLDADNRLQKLQDDLLNDPQNGALNKLGKDSFETPTTVRTKWESGVSDITASLNNDVQKDAFMRMAQSRGYQVHEAVQRHVSEQMKVYDTDQTTAFVEGQTKNGIAAYQNPDQVDQSIKMAQAALADHAKRNGLPPEWTTQKQADVESTIRAGVVQRMLTGEPDTGPDYDGAQAYYDQHKDQIQGPEKTSAIKSLEEGGIRSASKKAADEILSKPGITRDEALDLAGKIKEAGVSDMTASRIEAYFLRKKQAVDDARTQTMNTVTDIVERTHSRDSVPPQLWAGLDNAQHEAIDARIEKLHKGIEPATDWKFYYDQKALASSEATRAQFLATDLYTTGRNRLANAQFDDLINTQDALRKGDDKAADLGGYRTSAQVVHDTLVEAHIDPLAREGSDDAAKTTLFHREVDQQVAEFNRENGRKATAKDVQEIADRLMVRASVAGTWWGTNELRAFQLKQGQDAVIQVQDIPKLDRDQIKAALTSAGKAPTDAAVVALYKKRLMTMVQP